MRFWEPYGAEEIKADKMIVECFGGSVNFFTPIVLHRGLINPQRAYELSQGKIFQRLDDEFRDYMFGVTIVDAGDEKPVRNLELSTSFYSRQEANDYIKSLKDAEAVQND